MSVQLSELIDRIKKEGLQAAEDEAAGVRSQAEAQAARILQEARGQADSLIERAKAEALRFEQTGRASVGQAGRDVLLNLKKELERIFGTILNARVRDALQADVVKEALLSLFRNWRSEDALDFQVLVPEKAWEDLRDSVMAALGDRLRRGLEIKPSATLQVGFRVMEKDGSAYFDFSDAALVEFLMEHLNPKLAECLQEQAG